MHPIIPVLLLKAAVILALGLSLRTAKPRLMGAGGGGRRRLAALRARPWSSLTEAERLSLLTPDTQEVALEMVRRLRGTGLDARLGETYRNENDQRAKFEEGKSSIREPGWHTMGRAFHIIIVDPKTKGVQKEAYPVAGKLAAELGVIWKGDVVLHNKYGKEYRDLAHFEYHPGVTLAMARKEAGYA